MSARRRQTPKNEVPKVFVVQKERGRESQRDNKEREKPNARKKPNQRDIKMNVF